MSTTKKNINSKKKFENETKEVTRTREGFKKIKKIEIELSKGNFENLDYFLKWSGKQALDYALEWVSFYGKLDLVKKVIDSGANVNASNGTALQMACQNGHMDTVKYLVENGIFNKLPDLNILLEVVENKHIEIAKYLLGNENIFGTNICDIHCDYDCALRIAVQMNYVEMVDLLVKYGADVNIFDGYPFIYATKMNYIEIIKLLLPYTNQDIITNAIEIAISNDNNELVKLLKMNNI